MNGFLSELGKKLAERWLSLLALPGMLYLAAVTVAMTLGHAHPLDLGELSHHITNWSSSRSFRSVGGTVLIMVVALLGSIVVGLAVGALGTVVEMVWTLPGRRGPARWLAARRRSRSRKAKDRADNATSEAELAEAIAAANRICLLEADRPTWIGDRLRVTRLRIAAVYGLDLDSAWARLWLIVPEDTRKAVASAGDAFAASTRITAWGILYVLLGAWWWPSLLIGFGILVTARVRSRSATTNLAELIEAVVDLHAHELADSVKLAHDTYTDPDVGKRINRFVQKSRWDPTSALAD
ncbi:hypothetical protein [Actinomadura citrea]|uniref:Vegetative cell wall protein gp1 n=1 Tax=Actinomadura citrea TaxID=46158 RepID=A0A7Y9GFF0_9ACTN|nr:hypothetical protein [Actinomadura citrea]NYE15514.1 hypothetical protein [Actinomadura citrea]GGT65339.1 hypothetical protein GCM10010177_22870 [Actinomadura citrea]